MRHSPASTPFPYAALFRSAVIGVALIVTDTVLTAATVDLSVPVVCPLPSVAALGCVSVLPVPVEANTTFNSAMLTSKLQFPPLAVSRLVHVAHQSAVRVLG